MAVQHPIQVVARLSGLSPHVIRVWERRYGAVTPARTGTNRRLYSDEEVERLRLLGRATAAGHQIGIIARLGIEELTRLVATVEPMERRVVGGARVAVPSGGGGIWTGGPSATGEVPVPASGLNGLNSSTRVWPLPLAGGGDEAESLVRQALEATRSFAAAALMGVLENGALRLGHNGVLQRVVCPLAQHVGELWLRGELTAAHEHFASALIRDYLARSHRHFGLAEGAPRVVVATPAGQLHELGAVIVSAMASNLGWRTVYLGPSLPSAEIAGAALQNQARAVLLSIVYPADDGQLPGELRQLRRFLPAPFSLVVGGRAARAYEDVLMEIGALVPVDLQALCELLGMIQTGGSRSGGGLEPGI